MISYIEKGYSMHDWLQKQGVLLVQKDGVWTANVPDEQVNNLIAEYNPWSAEKSIKFAEIDNAFQAKVDSLTSGWPEGEIKTWTKQENEATLLQSNPNAITPTLSVIAATRGISVQELATRVLRDAALFTQATAYYVGLRHKARQKVQALPDVGEYHRLSELYNIRFEG